MSENKFGKIIKDVLDCDKLEEKNLIPDDVKCNNPCCDDCKHCEEDKCEHECKEEHDRCDEDCFDDECRKIAYQYADITVPVKAKPYVHVGKTKTKCCGEPKIIKIKGGCGCCEILVKQTIYTMIPLEYGAEVTAMHPEVNCEVTDYCKKDC